MPKLSENSSLADAILYPHLKITAEEFPRLLATRKILNKSDEYFGAFLPATNVRLQLFHLNRIFRLRSCEIEIDGDFEKPCQMFFAKKCLAPCVKEICERGEYLENVTALKLFLSGNDGKFAEFINDKIEAFSENLDFEAAARWRDILLEAQKLKDDKKLQISLENAVDTFDYEETANQIIVYLFTTRGRKFVGNMEFIFERAKEISASEIFEKIIREFYRFHVPREIRLPVFLPKRRELEKFLAGKFERKVKISFHRNDLNATARFRLKRTKLEYRLEKIGEKLSPDELKTALKRLFNLPAKPGKIECFDVAHISNQNFVTASSVWENGKIRPEKSEHFILDVENELQAMAFGVAERLKLSAPPDLLVVDGGKSQLNAVVNEIKNTNGKKPFVISAVKPPGRHNEISHILTADNRKIAFADGERVFELLRELRDEAHRAANEFYRQLHENQSIFSQNLPLVPIRFNEIDGAAEDLVPIKNNLR